MQQKKKPALRCDTSGDQSTGSGLNTPTQRSNPKNDSKKKALSESGSGGTKKSSKLIEKSPIKKSSKSMSKRNGSGDQDDSDGVQQPGNQKYIRKISDESFKQLPHIPDHEIAVFMVPEDLTEIERIKLLLGKEAQDQKTYFFNNIENIFFIKKQEYQNIYGPEYNLPKYKAKSTRHNYETQPSFRPDDTLQVDNVGTEEVETNNDKNVEIQVNGELQECITSGSKQGQHAQQEEEAKQDQQVIEHDADLQAKQELIQDQIFPLIFDKWLQSQNEYVQILAGESMLLLLKNEQLRFKDEYLVSLKNESLLMIDQWSADVIEIWIEVYALTLKYIVSRQITSGALKTEDFREECKKIVKNMTNQKQMCKVRMKGTSLMGLIAQYDSLGSSQLYEQYWLSNLHNICDDFHWEVRKDMCKSLIHISRYIGPEKSQQYILKEINYLLDDEEGEVATEAIVSFQKHLSEIYTREFSQSEEAAAMFEKLSNLAEDCDASLVNLGVVLKKLGKIIIAIDKPNDSEFSRNLWRIINKAQDYLFDEEIRAMLPACFEAICKIFSKNMRILIYVYDSKLKSFIQREIQNGIPQDKKPEKPTQPKSIYSDIIEKEISKYHRKVYNDKNFIINRSIAQNLHFFFGAFISAYTEQQQNRDKLQAVPLKMDQIENCLKDILQNYLLLVKTKDRELLHYVLFSFKSYNEQMTKVDIWLQLPESIKDLYMEIIKHIKQGEEVVKCSWRYHITYLKVVETIIDSNADYNDEISIKLIRERLDKDNSIQAQVKAFNSMINAERKELIKSLQSLVLDKRSEGTKIHERKTSRQALLYSIKILAKQMTTNKQQRFRQSITEYFTRLAKQKDYNNRSAYIEMVTVIVQGNMISTKTFQQTYFDHLMQILDDSTIARFQQRILKDILPGAYKLVQNSRQHIDKLLSSLKYLKVKTEQCLMKPDKVQPIPEELMRDIDEFVALLQDPDFQSSAVEYLQTTDLDLLRFEDELNGFVANEGTLTNRRGSDVKQSYQVLTDKQAAANKNREKKSISVRSGSKTGLRSTQLNFMNQEKQEITSNALVKAETASKRLKSMRPPSHSGVRKHQASNNQNVVIKNQEYQSSKINGRQSPTSSRRIIKNKNNSNHVIDSQIMKSNRPIDDANLRQNKENESGILQKLDNNRLNIKNRMIASSHSRNRDEEVRQSTDTANSHSEKINKGKVSMIEPQIIQGMSGDSYTVSSSRLPPKAAKKRENQQTAQSDSIAQYRSQQDNYAYTNSIDSGGLQIEKRESQELIKPDGNKEESQARSDHNVHRNNNGSLLNSRKPAKGQHSGAPMAKQERSTAASEYNKQYQIQLNKHISRKSNLTTGDQPAFQVLESSSDQPFSSYNGEKRQNVKNQYDGKLLMVNSKQTGNMKYMHLRNTRTNQISNDKQNQIFNLSDQVNELCANQTNEVPFIANPKSIDRIIQKAQNSISPNNRFQSNIPTIPQIPVPRSTDMARKSSQGFISLSNNPSQHNLNNGDKVNHHLPDVRISRKSLINNQQQAMNQFQYPGHASVSPPNQLDHITRHMDNPFPQHRALQGIRGGALSQSKPSSQHKVVRRSSQALKRNNHLGITANQILKNIQNNEKPAL